MVRISSHHGGQRPAMTLGRDRHRRLRCEARRPSPTLLVRTPRQRTEGGRSTPSSSHHDAPARPSVARPGTTAAASSGESDLDGMPVDVLNRDCARELRQALSRCGRGTRYPQSARTRAEASSRGADGRSAKYAAKLTGETAVRWRIPIAGAPRRAVTPEAPAATPSAARRRAPSVPASARWRATERPVIPAPTTTTSKRSAVIDVQAALLCTILHESAVYCSSTPGCQEVFVKAVIEKNAPATQSVHTCIRRGGRGTSRSPMSLQATSIYGGSSSRWSRRTRATSRSVGSSGSIADSTASRSATSFQLACRPAYPEIVTPEERPPCCTTPAEEHRRVSAHAGGRASQMMPLYLEVQPGAQLAEPGAQRGRGVGDRRRRASSCLELEGTPPRILKPGGHGVLPGRAPASLREREQDEVAGEELICVDTPPTM